MNHKSHTDIEVNGIYGSDMNQEGYGRYIYIYIYFVIYYIPYIYVPHNFLYSYYYIPYLYRSVCKEYNKYDIGFNNKA